MKIVYSICLSVLLAVVGSLSASAQEIKDAAPKTFWEALQSSEYGFWANVNPEVAHPRWSQATEEVIGTNERKPTLLFNGYGEYVAGMYKGLEKERLWA